MASHRSHLVICEDATHGVWCILKEPGQPTGQTQLYILLVVVDDPVTDIPATEVTTNEVREQNPEHTTDSVRIYG